MPVEGTILILDDDEAARELASHFLNNNGFTTVACASAESVFEKFHAAAGGVRMLIVDLTSRSFSAIEVAVQLKALRPEVKVLFLLKDSLAERYRRDESLLALLAGDSVEFLRQPYTEQELIAKVTELWNIRSAEEQKAAAAQSLCEEVERQTGLLDLAHDAILVRDNDGRICYWNRGAETLYGWSRSQVAGKVIHNLLQAVFPRPLRDIEKEVRETGLWEGELTHTKHDGTKIIVSSRWAIRKGPDNRIEILEINRDISAQKRVEAAFRGLNRELELRIDDLYKAEQMFRSLIESAPDAMVIVNRDGQIVLVNAQTEKMFGYSREELLNQTVEMLLPERVRSAHEEYRSEYVKQPRLRPMGSGLDLFGARKNGEVFPAEISLSQIETGGELLFCSVIRDISERGRSQHSPGAKKEGAT